MISSGRGTLIACTVRWRIYHSRYCSVIGYYSRQYSIIIGIVSVINGILRNGVFNDGIWTGVIGCYRAVP